MSENKKFRPACFLDRDGVLNVEKGYIHKIKDFQWIEGAIASIKLLKEKGYYVFVATNQSGISRGYYSEKDVLTLHDFINSKLLENNTKIDDFFYSPYHPDFNNKYANLSHLRKPETGMLDMAFKKWKFNKNGSFMIGDQITDIKCAKKFGINGYLFKGGSLLKFIKSINELK